MAKIIGRNALVYIGGAVAPNRNQVTINFNRELQEARVFQDEVAGGPWSDQVPGFRSWTIAINGFYDDSSDVILQYINAVGPQHVVVYEQRTSLTKYWYGLAYFTINEEIGVDNIVTVNLSGTGTGALGRFQN